MLHNSCVNLVLAHFRQVQHNSSADMVHAHLLNDCCTTAMLIVALSSLRWLPHGNILIIFHNIAGAVYAIMEFCCSTLAYTNIENLRLIKCQMFMVWLQAFDSHSYRQHFPYSIRRATTHIIIPPLGWAINLCICYVKDFQVLPKFLYFLLCSLVAFTILHVL